MIAYILLSIAFVALCAALGFLAWKFWNISPQISSLNSELIQTRADNKTLRAELELTRADNLKLRDELCRTQTALEANTRAHNEDN